MVLEHSVFYTSIILELVIGYWYNVLAEKLPEPGSTVALASFLILLCILFDCVFRIAKLATGKIDLLTVIPKLLIEWIFGICLLFVPLFCAVSFNLANLEFFVMRSFIMVTAWFIPYIFTFKDLREEWLG